jgi:hypothetical protein
VTAIDVDRHVFNDDLLMDEQTRAAVTERYRTVAHVLDHGTLRELFQEYDGPANKAKRRGRLFGFISIVCILTAFIIASSEHFVPPGHDLWSRILAALSAVLGIAGATIGSIGVLHSRKKRQWLYGRLMTERIRQFHFQTMIRQLPQIRASLREGADREAFLTARAGWLAGFKAQFAGKLDSQFADIVESEGSDGLWLHPRHAETGFGPDVPELNPLFEAYRELRILHQIGYASRELSDFNRKGPRAQHTILSTLSVVSIGLLCVIHVGIVVLVLAGGHEPAKVEAVLASLTIWIALSALAVRAVEQGLQPEREIERYQQYRSAVRAVLERFELANSQAEKLRTMSEMERLSFDEMRNFLITSSASRFVM